MQQAIQARTTTLHAYEDQAVQFDLRTMRKIGQADVDFNVTPITAIIVHIKNTNRDGHIPFGGTFGFSNAVEIPMPLDNRTTDLKTALRVVQRQGPAPLRLGRFDLREQYRQRGVGQPAGLRSRRAGAPARAACVMAQQYLDLSARHRCVQHPRATGASPPTPHSDRAVTASTCCRTRSTPASRRRRCPEPTPKRKAR